MYSALAKHSGISLTMKCTGDLWIDDHHTADRFHTSHGTFSIAYRSTLHRTALSPLAQRSKKPWEKFAESADMEPVLRRSTKYGPYRHPWLLYIDKISQALSRAVIDICSRPYCVTDLGLKREKIGDLSTEMIPHIFYSFAIASGVTLHVDVLRGENDHHRSVSS
jgi:imidazoleglycerol-phosphate dehydratase